MKFSLSIGSILSVALVLSLSPACAQHGGNGNHRGHNGSNVAVMITPTSSSIQVGQSQQFTGSVSGTSNTGLIWLVNGVLGGNSTVGTVSSSGLYTAPAAAPSNSVKVTAQSTVQSTASASATVAISAPLPVSVAVSPASTSVKVGQTQAFSATVSGTSNTAVNWLVNGVVGGSSSGGTISSSGMYTAPAVVPSSSVQVEAQSAAQSTAVGNATVSVMPATVSVSISPTNTSLQVGQSQQFSAQVTGTTNTGVNWLVSGILAGNTSVGTISSAGLYTAPGNVPPSPVTVTAQSIANPNTYASTSVTVTPQVQHSVSLSWSDTASVAGYNVYRGTQSTGPFVRINPSLDTATVYTDNSVTSGQTYYYATTAVDTSGVESTYSNVAQAAIP
jgi:Bacterial Ig-like domain (group 2)